MTTKEILAHLRARLGDIAYVMEYARTKERKAYYKGQADCLEFLIKKIKGA